MSGLNRITGRALSDEASHLAQSINDILSTPLGSRVLRRTYGSELPRLIDAPLNGETLVDLYAATAEALALWEPRITLNRVQVSDVVAGGLTLILEGDSATGPLSLTIRPGVLA